MPSINQIHHLLLCKVRIAEPILIIGSKEYDFDQENFLGQLHSWGFSNVTGIDLSPGAGVDHVVNICDESSSFISNHLENFNTIICMQVLYATENPFVAAGNIERLLSVNGTLLFSDVFSHKIHRIPRDYWRFTYDAHKVLFKSLVFDDSKAYVGITRTGEMKPLDYPLPEISSYQRHNDESQLAFLLRRVHRKYLSGGVFKASRFLPEISIFSLATKPRVENENGTKYQED
jgi:hypothetical protein